MLNPFHPPHPAYPTPPYSAPRRKNILKSVNSVVFEIVLHIGPAMLGGFIFVLEMP